MEQVMLLEVLLHIMKIITNNFRTMNLEKLNLVELDTQEVKETDGGFFFLIPLATVVMAVGAVAGTAALGYYNGYNDTKK